MCEHGLTAACPAIFFFLLELFDPFSSAKRVSLEAFWVAEVMHAPLESNKHRFAPHTTQCTLSTPFTAHPHGPNIY
jgi:hypothetical protein